MPRIQINDLPTMQTLTPERLKELFGAGQFKPGMEALENRIVLTGNIDYSPDTGVLTIDGDDYQDVAHVRTFKDAAGDMNLSVDLYSANDAGVKIDPYNPQAGKGVDYLHEEFDMSKVSEIVFKDFDDAGDFHVNKSAIKVTDYREVIVNKSADQTTADKASAEDQSTDRAQKSYGIQSTGDNALKEDQGEVTGETVQEEEEVWDEGKIPEAGEDIPGTEGETLEQGDENQQSHSNTDGLPANEEELGDILAEAGIESRYGEAAAGYDGDEDATGISEEDAQEILAGVTDQPETEADNAVSDFNAVASGQLPEATDPDILEMADIIPSGGAESTFNRIVESLFGSQQHGGMRDIANVSHEVTEQFGDVTVKTYNHGPFIRREQIVQGASGEETARIIEDFKPYINENPLTGPEIRTRRVFVRVEYADGAALQGDHEEGKGWSYESYSSKDNAMDPIHPIKGRQAFVHAQDEVAEKIVDGAKKQQQGQAENAKGEQKNNEQDQAKADKKMDSYDGEATTFSDYLRLRQKWGSTMDRVTLRHDSQGDDVDPVETDIGNSGGGSGDTSMLDLTNPDPDAGSNPGMGSPNTPPPTAGPDPVEPDGNVQTDGPYEETPDIGTAPVDETAFGSFDSEREDNEPVFDQDSDEELVVNQELDQDMVDQITQEPTVATQSEDSTTNQDVVQEGLADDAPQANQLPGR